MSDPIDPIAMRARARELADQLADGWSKGRPDVMVGVFADDPTFLETPFSTPIHGRDAIRQWAADIPYYQSEAAFTVGEVLVAGPWFATEFKLVFRRRTSGDWVDARGAFFAETDGSKITELRMYWHRWNGGRETSIA
ncbi:MAG: nuclear transport factor 2 family protein [Gemmatimonadales bacterium]